MRPAFSGMRPALCQAPGNGMRLAFMGSPDFAVPALVALHDAGHVIAAVYCQPPRPAGRGQEWMSASQGLAPAATVCERSSSISLGSISR